MKSGLLKRIWVVFGKEFQDNIRDRRALTSMMMGTLLGPGLMLLLFFVLGRQFTAQAEKTLEIPVAGVENAPNLVAFLAQNNINVVDPPENPEGKVRTGDYDVVLVIPEDFGVELSQGRPAAIQIIVDESRQSSALAVERVRRALRAYNNTIAAMRLVARGVSPTVMDPLVVETIDVATPQSQAAQLLNMMPYFIIFSVFLGGMHLAIDTTAGERERGSLEALLINPIARKELVVGKLGAIVVFTIASLTGTLVAFALMLTYVPLVDFLGTRISLDLGTLVVIFLISLPMTVLAGALQMIISSFARSFKEAQSYLSFLPLIPALPGMFLAFVPVKPTIWMMTIPTFGQQLLINQLLREEPILMLNVAVSAVVTLVVAAAFVLVAMGLYERETILFGR